jgi:CheY-like chemotaxis protein
MNSLHNVILADDVLLELELERTFFQRSGFRVLTATDGLSALALAIAELPDILVLDQFMPGLTGTQICARMRDRKDTRAIPIVITTARDSEELREECRRAGVNALVPKSAGRDALLRVVAQILRVPERKAMRLTVFFSVLGHSEKETLGKGTDICEGGMALETNQRYELGASMRLRFLLPGERQEFQAIGKVQRVSQRPDGTYSIGLEFTDLEADVRRRLNVYIDRSLSVR